jgi:thiamine biosynthesis lipoprotein
MVGVFLGAGVPGVAAKDVTLTGRAMGTVWTAKIDLSGGDAGMDEGVVSRRISERLEQLEQIFSTYRPDSELTRFNRHAGRDWFPVAPEHAHVAAESRRISALTAGAFDVTVLPLVELWGFGATGGAGRIPSAGEIARARARVDWRHVEVQESPPALRKVRGDMAADFSSLAKGFAADDVGRLLVRLGFTRHLVQVGGDVKTTGEGWPVAVERPLDDAREVEAVVMLSGDALSTSGDYRNFFRAGGRRYGHIVDPRTGEPVAHALAAVSVIDPSCARSSALATALFVLGPDEGWRLAERERIAALFVVRAGDGFVRRMTPEFGRRLRDRGAGS